MQAPFSVQRTALVQNEQFIINHGKIGISSNLIQQKLRKHLEIYIKSLYGQISTPRIRIAVAMKQQIPSGDHAPLTHGIGKTRHQFWSRPFANAAWRRRNGATARGALMADRKHHPSFGIHRYGALVGVDQAIRGKNFPKEPMLATVLRAKGCNKRRMMRPGVFLVVSEPNRNQKPASVLDAVSGTNGDRVEKEVDPLKGILDLSWLGKAFSIVL